MSDRPPVSIVVKNCKYCSGRIRFTNDFDQDGKLTHRPMEADGKTPHRHDLCPGCKIKTIWDSENGFRWAEAKTIKRHNCAKLQKLTIARDKEFPGMGEKVVPLEGIHKVQSLDEVMKLPSTIGVGYEQKSPYTEEEKEKQWVEYKKEGEEPTIGNKDFDNDLRKGLARNSNLAGEAIDSLTKKLADTIARVEKLESKMDEAWKNITNLQELDFKNRERLKNLENDMLNVTSWINSIVMWISEVQAGVNRFKPAEGLKGQT